jgi:hypothetical protein
MAEPTGERDAHLAERNEGAVRFAAVLLAVIAVPATVATWLGPWNADSLSMRLSMPGFAALFVAVAVTGQHSREAHKALRWALLLTLLGWGLGQAVPLLHLPIAYFALTLCVALLAAAGFVKLDGAASGAAVAAAIVALLALAWYLDRLGTYTPPLPDYLTALFATLVPVYAVIGAAIYRRRWRPRRPA